MTRVPHTIGLDIPISKAGAVMRESGIRHLPVLKEGKLVGIISERDVAVAKCFPGPGELVVEDIMTPDPYVVSSEAFIDDVIAEMVEHKYGSAVVQAPTGKVVGILTTIDALKILQEIMHRYYAHSAA
jgi:acetoin utilization protein AcuB